MSTYKKITDHSRTIYQLHGLRREDGAVAGYSSILTEDELPPTVREAFEAGQDSVEWEEGPSLAELNKACLFCGIPECKLTRALHGEIIYLCHQHYYDKNLGQVAQKLREDLEDESKVSQENQAHS